MKTINIKNLTESERKELMEQIATEQKKERIALNKKRKTYEANRERRIQKTIKGVSAIETAISKFKQELSVMMQDQHQELEEFGQIPSKSKGGFSIISKDGNFKITRSRDTDPKWDETAHKGVELVKKFLVDQGLESNNPGIYNLLMGLISKNEAGELEYSKVMHFIKHESEFEDPEWKEGLRLIKEGYSIDFKKFGYQFFKKDAEGKFKNIVVNFSNI